MKQFDFRQSVNGTATIAALAGIAVGGTVAAGSLLYLTAASLNGTAVVLALVAGGAAAFALVKAGGLRARADKLSSEMNEISARLLRIESRSAEPDRQSGRLSSTVAEVTGEIALLGGLVRDLAETVALQDRDVAALKTELETSKAPPPVTDRALVVRTPAPALATIPSVELAPRPRGVIPSLFPVPEAALAASRDEVVDAAENRRIAAVVDAFENDRIELHMQPVVSLPQRKPRFYEILTRLRLADDTILVPAEFLPVLERRDLVVDLDRKVLTRAAAIARHLAARGSEARVSCNLSGASVEAGILRAAGRIAEAYPDVADRLILELSQRSWRSLDADKAGTLAQLRSKGFGLALDRATDLRLDPLTLAERGVAYVKLSADLLLRPDAGRPDIVAGDLAAILARAGIRLIAERVEREEDVPDLIDLNVPLAQGFVFAPPRAVRPEVLAQPPQADAKAEAQAGEKPAARPPEALPAVAAQVQPERQPFRAFLRRAG
jgi:cyclic-di-GMP phosphodiesterase TipF (flagellum assembly factor)